MMPGGRRGILASEPIEPTRLPREVWVASLYQAGLSASRPTKMTQEMLRRMEQIIPQQPDIICVPEMFQIANMTGPKPSLQ